MLTFGSHYEYSQTQSEKTALEGKACVVSSQTWGVLFESDAVVDPLSSSSETSFSRSSFPSTYQNRNGAPSRGAAELVLWNVQENEIPQCSVLRSMWSKMARLCLLSSQVSERLCGLLQWLRRGPQYNSVVWQHLDGASTSESEAKSKRALWKENTSEAAEERQGKGPSQGQRERCFRTAGCSTSASTSLDGTLCSPSPMAGDANASCRSTTTRTSSRTEAQRSHEPSQEEGRPGHSRDCQQIRLPWQEDLQEANAQCCERSRQGQECHGRSDPGQIQLDEQLANVPHGVLRTLEGVHKPFSTTGTEMHGRNFSSKRGSQQGEDRISGTYAGRSRGDLRRGCGHQRADRSSLQNSGRNGEHAQQSRSAFRTGGEGQGRSRGEITQKTSQVHPRRRWRCSYGCWSSVRGLQAVSLAAFSTAGSVMAFGCIGHRAVEPVDAIIMQWNHSAVHEWRFVPPWDSLHTVNTESSDDVELVQREFQY